MRFFGRRALTVGGVFAFAAATAALGVFASPVPGLRLANVGAFGGEPSIASNAHGELYDTTPSGGTPAPQVHRPRRDVEPGHDS
jgi:hypothetical protein